MHKRGSISSMTGASDAASWKNWEQHSSISHDVRGGWECICRALCKSVSDCSAALLPAFLCYGFYLALLNMLSHMSGKQSPASLMKLFIFALKMKGGADHIYSANDVTSFLLSSWSVVILVLVKRSSQYWPLSSYADFIPYKDFTVRSETQTNISDNRNVSHLCYFKSFEVFL